MGPFLVINIVFLVGLVIILLKAFFMQDRVVSSYGKKYDLKKDGFIVLKNVLSSEEIEEVKRNCYSNDYYNAKRMLISNNYLLQCIKTNIEENNSNNSGNYVFQDYIWIIKKSSVHICHRDNNGDFFNQNQQYPSYTLLVYLEDAEKCLGVIPRSHHDVNSFNVNINMDFNNVDVVQYLPCEKGDAILFNANLIHVGALNKHDNLRIQMKVSHKDDLEVLSYYEDYNKVLNTENNLPSWLKHTQKNVSCMFPFVSNLTQRENIRSARGSDNGVKIGVFQKIFSYLFYGNSKFYDLPNAF